MHFFVVIRRLFSNGICRRNCRYSLHLWQKFSRTEARYIANCSVLLFRTSFQDKCFVVIARKAWMLCKCDKPETRFSRVSCCALVADKVASPISFPEPAIFVVKNKNQTSAWLKEGEIWLTFVSFGHSRAKLHGLWRRDCYLWARFLLTLALEEHIIQPIFLRVNCFIF